MLESSHTGMHQDPDFIRFSGCRDVAQPVLHIFWLSQAPVGMESKPVWNTQDQVPTHAEGYYIHVQPRLPHPFQLSNSPVGTIIRPEHPLSSSGWASPGPCFQPQILCMPVVSLTQLSAGHHPILACVSDTATELHFQLGFHYCSLVLPNLFPSLAHPYL